VWAETDRGIAITRDGGLSWRASEDKPAFESPGIVNFSVNGWRIPTATWVFETPKGAIAGGPGGAYRTTDRVHWTEIKLWPDQETGAADFLHAYWMGRYYKFYKE
jgi:hypothetical protein